MKLLEIKLSKAKFSLVKPSQVKLSYRSWSEVTASLEKLSYVKLSWVEFGLSDVEPKQVKLSSANRS